MEIALKSIQIFVKNSSKCFEKKNPTICDFSSNQRFFLCFYSHVNSMFRDLLLGFRLVVCFRFRSGVFSLFSAFLFLSSFLSLLHSFFGDYFGSCFGTFYFFSFKCFETRSCISRICCSALQFHFDWLLFEKQQKQWCCNTILNRICWFKNTKRIFIEN